jgi:hypothetical protein
MNMRGTHGLARLATYSLDLNRIEALPIELVPEKGKGERRPVTVGEVYRGRLEQGWTVQERGFGYSIVIDGVRHSLGLGMSNTIYFACLDFEALRGAWYYLDESYADDEAGRRVYLHMIVHRTDDAIEPGMLSVGDKERASELREIGRDEFDASDAHEVRRAQAAVAYERFYTEHGAGRVQAMRAKLAMFDGAGVPDLLAPLVSPAEVVSFLWGRRVELQLRTLARIGIGILVVLIAILVVLVRGQP